MKMKKDDFKELRTAITKAKNKHPQLTKIYKEGKISATRYRWDLLWSSKVNTNKYYEYLNDSHIDTALKQALKEEI